MLTNAKLLDLLYNSATCYIPTEDLTEEQLERFDNITYRWCNCRRCKKALKIRDRIVRPQYIGHADKKTLEISLSEPVLREVIALPAPISLLELIGTCLHEIAHVLFPEFNEDQTNDKTWEWLRRNEWVRDAEKFDREAKAWYEKELGL